jgi:hypothetical protein
MITPDAPLLKTVALSAAVALSNVMVKLLCRRGPNGAPLCSASIAALSGGGLNPVRRPHEHPANVNLAPEPVSF